MMIVQVFITMGAFMLGYYLALQEPIPLPIQATIVEECQCKRPKDCIPELVYSKLINECSNMALKFSVTLSKKDRDNEDCWEQNKSLTSDLDDYRYR